MTGSEQEPFKSVIEAATPSYWEIAALAITVGAFAVYYRLCRLKEKIVP